MDHAHTHTYSHALLDAHTFPPNHDTTTRNAETPRDAAGERLSSRPSSRVSQVPGGSSQVRGRRGAGGAGGALGAVPARMGAWVRNRGQGY